VVEPKIDTLWSRYQYRLPRYRF